MRSKDTGERVLRCPVCGKLTDTLINGMCKECYYSRLLEKLLPNKIHVKMCSICGKFDTAPLTKLKSILKNKLQKFNIKYQIIKLDEKTFEIYIVIDNEIKFSKKVEVEIEKYTCRSCSCRAGGYYEAVVQFRGKNWKYAANVFRILIENTTRNFAFISGETEVKNGIDYRVGSKTVAEQILKKMEKEYKIGYIAERSFKVVGIDRQTSKPKVRFTYVFRTYDLPIGKVFLFRSRPYKVVGYEEKYIKARDLISRNIIKLNIDEVLTNYSIIETNVGEVIYIDDKKLLFLDEKNTLQETDKFEENLKIGDKIEYIEFGNEKIVVGKHVCSQEKGNR